MSKDRGIPISRSPDVVLQQLNNELRQSLGHIEAVAVLLTSPRESLREDTYQVMADKLLNWLAVTKETLDDVDTYLQDRNS